MEKIDIPAPEQPYIMESKSATITTMTTTTTFIPEFRFPYYVWRYIVYLASKRYTDVLRLYPSVMSKVNYTMRPRFFVRAWFCDGATANKRLHERESFIHRANCFWTNNSLTFRLAKVQRVTNKYYKITIYKMKKFGNTYKIYVESSGRKLLKEGKGCYFDLPIKYGIQHAFMGTGYTDFWRMREAVDIRSLKNFKTDYVDKFDLHHNRTSNLLQEVRQFYECPNTPFGRMKLPHHNN